MTTLLIGGAGLLGGAIAAELAGRGQPWRALVRSEQRASRLRALGAEIVTGDMRDPRTLSQALSGARTSHRVALLAGPEGGWPDHERTAAREAGWTSVTLGPQVLRTETAGIAALAIWNAVTSAAKES